MNNDLYYVGQIFTSRYPDEAIIWSNYNGYKMINIGKNELDQDLWQIQEPDNPNPDQIPPAVKISNLKKELFDLNYYMQRKYQAGVKVPDDINSKIESIYTQLGELEEYSSQLDFTNALMKYNYSDIMNNIISSIYPIGSIYIGIQDTCPIQDLGIGKWALISTGRVLQGSDDNHNAGTTIEAGLPNITGYVGKNLSEWNRLPFPAGNCSGALYFTNNFGAHDIDGGWNNSNRGGGIAIDASRSNPIYGRSNTVQPPAYVVNIWQRTS